MAMAVAVVAGWGLCGAAGAAAHEFQDGWRPFRDSTIQDHGFQWAKVGHAGNADWTGLALPFGPVVSVGGVDYRYRVAKTEVTNRQWYEFVQAYAPFVPDQFALSTQFTGLGVGIGGSGYVLISSTAERGAEVGWRFAARYANWLHNGKVNEAWAFESGVYDTSTFSGLPGEQVTDQRERSGGARYFLPTLDEWIKAVHFDQDRFGEGQEGYWLHSYSSDTAPVTGQPGAPGAQTNAGGHFFVPILSYPGATTPWGLWDASGSVQEWLEDLGPLGDARLVDGSHSHSAPSIDFLDRLSNWDGRWPSSLIGVRLASVIPGPGTSLVALPLALGMVRRRHRQCLARPCSGARSPP
jgi:hypothetical protein